jgi:methionine synthase II (cobalamin-independent)
MDFNPRTATGIPTEPVGSIPRPLKLQQAYAAYDAEKISKAQLEEEQNAAVADTIKRRPDRRLSRTASSASRASQPIRLPIRLPELDWRPT